MRGGKKKGGERGLPHPTPWRPSRCPGGLVEVLLASALLGLCPPPRQKEMNKRATGSEMGYLPSPTSQRLILFIY